MLVDVAVAAPVRGTFTYEAAPDPGLVPGRRLVVPFGRRRAIGFYLGPAPAAATPQVGPAQVKKVEALLDDGPVLPPDVLELLRFAADYYQHPLGEALRGALPPELSRLGPPPKERAPAVEAVVLVESPEVAAAALSRSRSQAALVAHLAARGGAAYLEELEVAVRGAAALVRKLEARGLVRLVREAPREPEGDAVFHAGPPPELRPAQQEAASAITGALGSFRTFLLHGITGSGKTEVYLRVIAEARARGKGALVLVPEIALTPQLAGRFRSRFGADIAVLHSGLTDRERGREHRRLLAGEAHIAVGVRSGVFAPVHDLGVIVVDEEHDPSFKQEERFRYHARDLAVYRARIAGAPCVLGSATPSLESLHNVTAGRYERLRLPDRATGRPMPRVEIVDLARRIAPVHGEPEVLTEPLLEALTEVLDARQQAILFLNRRGHATLLLCRACGRGASCPNCDVTLTHHLARAELRCHYCDHREKIPEVCPDCGGELLAIGVGTERVERTLRRRLPGARVLRLDRDAVTTSTELTRVLAAFARGEGDVLVGTQMVTKGHDFPGVTLVGVVLADVGLAMPDFRAAERTFQLLSQVAGRAGRGVDPGRVIIQTFHPRADAITFAVAHDYDGFAARELARREELGYPPFTRMLAVRVDAVALPEAERAAHELAALVRGRPGLRVLGPAPAPIPRLRGRHRFQILLVAPTPPPLHAAGRVLTAAIERVKASVRAGVDVDPVSML